MIKDDANTSGADAAPARNLSLIGFVGRALGLALGEPGLGAAMGLAMVLQLFYLLFIPLGLKALFDRGLLHSDSHVVWLMLGILSLGFLGHAGASVAQEFVAARLATRALVGLRSRLYDHVLRLSRATTERDQVGDIAACFTADMTAIEAAIVRAIPALIIRLALMAGSLATAFALNWGLATATIVAAPVALLAPRRLSTLALDAAYRRRQADASLSEHVLESLALAWVIRVFRLQDERRGRFDTIAAAVDDAAIRANGLGNLVGKVVSVGVSFLLLLVIGLGAVLSLHGVISPGVVVAFILILLNMGAGAAGLAEAVPLLIAGGGALRRIDEVLATPVAPTPSPDAANVVDRIRTIEFDGVSFSYDGTTPTVDDVSFALDLPRSIAFVGPSGSGKSTILNLLLNVHSLARGRILLDGIDSRDLAEESLRRSVSVVAQETRLFRMSIRDNIRMGRLDASDDDIRAAAKAADLHETIMAMPQGYGTDVGELGGRLSGGQRQRVGIARALVRNPDVLLLDEVTAALDPATENAINRTLMGLRGARTIVAVTHRLNQAALMDEIFVVDQGRVVEHGSHEALLNQGGLYAKLWAKQSGLVLSDDGLSAAITPERLGQIPLFAGLATAKLAEIAATLLVETARAGDILLEEKQSGGRFYIIVRGMVELSVAGRDSRPIQLEILEVGDFLGEIALLEDIPQLATARALTPCTLLSMRRADFQALLAAETALYDHTVEIIDRRIQAKLDELVYKRIGMA